MSIVLHWFRTDLRIADHPALAAALKRGATVGVFFLPVQSRIRAPGGASLWWLHHSLAALQKQLRPLNVPLLLLDGDPESVIPDLAKRHGLSAVSACHGYEAGSIREEKSLRQSLLNIGVEFLLSDRNLLHDPFQHATKTGGSYKVFTPFWNSLRQIGDPPAPIAAPKPQKPTAQDEKTIAAIMASGRELKDWKLLPTTPDWAGGLRDNWNCGADAALERLDEFLDKHLKGYADRRNRPDMPGTSRLSPHLRWGEISVRQIWHRTAQYCQAHKSHHLSGDAEVFLKEVAWRDFSYHLLAHFPELHKKSWRDSFEDFPWRHDPKSLRAWQRGETGYPNVDAGMRQLRQTGWMHNRVRMIAASFLIKHLLIDWRHGEDWFWDNLVDADPASNPASWQWVAGCGADAAPYFRIFNPILQGEKFDPKGDYIREFVPELSGLPAHYIHQPWQAPPMELAQYGVTLGKTYPHPIVEHDAARKRALAALKSLKAA